MKSLYIKEIKNRKNLKKKELILLWCRSSFLTEFYSSQTKEKFVFHFFLITKNYYYFSKLKNRCFFSNRSRSFLFDFGLSRIKFRELSSFGILNGIRKSSW